MKRAGFTLLEAMVSLTIIGLVAIGALEAFAAESRAARQAQLTIPAVAIASERLAQLELLDGVSLGALPDSLRSGRISEGGQSYEWRASTGRVAQEPDLFALSVEVKWEAGAYALATRVYRPRLVGAR